MRYLTGTSAQVAEAGKQYRVYWSKADESDEDETDYLVDHTIVVYMIAPNGDFVDFFTQSVDEDEMFTRIQKHIRTANTSN